MIEKPEFFEAALKRAADTERRTVASLTERIIREWLVSHAFLAPAMPPVSGRESFVTEPDRVAAPPDRPAQ